MAYYLGIDGGGTGCRARVTDAEGRILGQGEAGPANVRSDTEGTYHNVMRAVAQAVAGTGALPEELTAVLGLAGANVTAAADRLAAMLPFRQMRIVDDGVTNLRGALGRRDGILAALGTGSVFARQYRGAVWQVGGRGFILGDECSGSVLGRMLLSDVLRAEDGMIPMTPLLAEILAEMGGGEAIIAWGFAAKPVDFAALVPKLVGSDDPAARAILSRAGDDLRGILRVLQPEAGALPVVFTGGLGPVYAAMLSGEVTVLPAAGSALDGAVALALELGRDSLPQVGGA